ncbi:hypothetical protein BU15DRAFT_77931 [Melanogaster broomeanus]|nr:hypothetical protein BU15DRAFT_77931 [Melanogaster broomeanus]
MAQLMGHAGLQFEQDLPSNPTSKAAYIPSPSRAQSKAHPSSISAPSERHLIEHFRPNRLRPLPPSFTMLGTSSIACKEGQNLSLQVHDQESRTRSEPNY